MLQQKEAGTQVELVSESSDSEDDEQENSNPSEAARSADHFLGPLDHVVKTSEGSSLTSVLEGSGVALYPASSSDLENMIASLPLVNTPLTKVEQPSVSQDKQQVGCWKADGGLCF